MAIETSTTADETGDHIEISHGSVDAFVKVIEATDMIQDTPEWVAFNPDGDQVDVEPEPVEKLAYPVPANSEMLSGPIDQIDLLAALEASIEAAKAARNADREGQQ